MTRGRVGVPAMEVERRRDAIPVPIIPIPIKPIALVALVVDMVAGWFGLFLEFVVAVVL